MSEGNNLLRLTRLEFRKLRKGIALYIISAVIVLFAILITSNMDDNYSRQVQSINQHRSEITSMIETGQMVVYGNAIPDTMDYQSYIALDDNGHLLPANIEFWKEFYNEYFDSEIVSLTAEGGYYSFSAMTRNAAFSFASFIPVLAVAAGVTLFASEYRNSTYRLIISRGVTRSGLMGAKVLTVVGLGLYLALLATLAVSLAGFLSFQNLSSSAPAVFSFAAIASIFGVAAFMFIGYMMGGAALGTLVASPTTAMTVGLIIAFIGGNIFLMASPCMDNIIGLLSPLSLGYNYGSLMQEFWVTSNSMGFGVFGDTQNCYRDVVPSIIVASGYTAFYTLAVFTIFRRKELKT
ncbi:MAG: ABC transporter permease subunit [Dehalogenimonas sp.]